MYVDYDTYAKMSPLRKNNVLHQLAPENVAEIVTTHWRRFLDQNRDRLNREQIQFIEEAIAWIRPEHYRQPRDERAIAAHSDMQERRMFQLFSREDIGQLHMGAFKNSGEIPNPIARTLVRTPARFDEATGESLQASLYELAKRSPHELRRELPEILGRAFEGMPAAADFWRLVDDEDVRLAAFRAYGMVRSKRVRNPIALGLRNQKPGLEAERVETVQAALRDLSERPAGELAACRYGDDDLPTVLARAFQGMPSGDEFWRSLDDEDVRMAAHIVRVRIEMHQSGALPPPGQRR